MPVDPAALRRIVDHNERVAEAIRARSEMLEKLSPQRCEESSACAEEWAKNVQEVLLSLESQQELSRAMRESARVSDEAQSEVFRDRYRFLVDRLKGEVRGFFFMLKDFVDLPQDFQRQKTWNDCVYDMEVDLKSLGAISAGEHGLASVDPIVAMLNYRDKVVSLTLSGILFQKAVLDWDLKNERDFADGPIVEMAEKVVNIYSKTESVPAKLRLADLSELPKELEAGPFTFQQARQGKSPNTLTPLQCRLLTVLREVDSLDKGMRHMKFAEKVHLDVRNKSTGKDSAVEPLRQELIKWSEKCERLQQALKASRNSKGVGGMELEAEKLLTKVSEKEQTIKEKSTTIHKLEGDFQSLKYDLINQRREKNELQDKIARMSKENLPVLDKMKQLLGRSQEAVSRLVSDTAVLSEVFRLQVQENKKIAAERDNISQELLSVQEQLKDERQMRKVKEEAVQKKESLYLRTMAARRSIHESCMEQEAFIGGLDARMTEKGQEIEDMRQAIASKDEEIEEMKVELLRAKKRAEELDSQQRACLREYEAATGQPKAGLLSRIRAVPTLQQQGQPR